MNTIDSTTMGYCVIKFVSESYTLQEDTTFHGKISTYGELFVKVHSLMCMQENTKWYWEQKHQQQVIIFPTGNIVHPCLDSMVVKDFMISLEVFATETNQNSL